MAKLVKPRKKPAKYHVGDSVLYESLPYQVDQVVPGQNNDYWYTLKDRLGTVHETELKKQS